jgi:phosphate-selective porin OprO/OprP
MNFNKKLAVAVSGAVLLMAGQVALADSATDIVDALVSKGVLTEEEGKLITKGHTAKTSVTPVVKEKDGAFTLESANGRNSIQLTGRMHLDYRDSDIDQYGTPSDRDTASMADQFELRRARIGVKGKLAKDFKYEIVTNITGNATVDVAYLDFARYEQFQLRVGKFKQPFNLEEQISSNNITFMERSYVNQTAPGKKQGLMVMGAPIAGMTYAGSVFQNNDTELNIGPDGKNSFAGRATINFAELMGNKEMVMHLGLAGLESNYAVGSSQSSQTDKDYASASNTSNNTQTATISAFRSAGRGLNNIFRGQVYGVACTTGAASCASEFSASVRQKSLGLEGIFAYGPFKLMGEYSAGDYRGQGTYTANANEVTYDTKTYYLEAGYFITGEKYADSYKGGVFSSFKPKNEFDLEKGNLGAIELAFRAEGFDVNDTSFSASTAGRVQGILSNTNSGSTSTSGAKSGAKTYTAGVRWILNPNLIIKANYAQTNFDSEYKPIDITNTVVIDKERLLMFRTQYMF